MSHKARLKEFTDWDFKKNGPLKHCAHGIYQTDEQEYPRACGGLTPCPLCNAVAGRHTWDLPQPTGYIYNNIWYPLNCRPHAYTTQQCFKNTEVCGWFDDAHKNFISFVFVFVFVVLFWFGLVWFFFFF